MVDINHDAAANLELATTHLKKLVSPTLGDDVEVKLERGVSISNYKPGASEENIKVTFKSDKFKDPVTADQLGQALLKELHNSEDLREHAVFLSPADQLAFNKQEVAELQKAARDAGVPFPPHTDFTQADILDASFSRNQLPKHATQVIDGPDVTTIRINIPTNPNNLEAAESLAQEVEASVKQRLPEIKSGMIKRIKEKAYAQMTPEMEQHMNAHEFTVNTQQQGNWTSVFINIRSPEQVKVRDNPEEKNKFDNAFLEKTNMLQKVENADQRAKIAARAAMFEGEKLGTPTSYFMKVAGTEDIKIGLGKMLNYLKAKKPEYSRRIDALMKESFLMSNEEWNLPPDQQPIRKRAATLGVKAGKDEMTMNISTQVGKGDELLKALAAHEWLKPEEAKKEQKTADGQMVSDVLDKIVNDAVAASGAVVACPPGEIAVAGAGAAVVGGEAVAGAGGACIPPAVEPAAITEKKSGVVLPNGKTISNKAISSLLKEVRSFTDRAEDKGGSLTLGA